MIEEKTLMKDDMVAKLAVLLTRKLSNTTMADALDMVINSKTYQRLIDDNTSLYYQSPYYVYDFLSNELTTGKVE